MSKITHLLKRHLAFFLLFLRGIPLIVFSTSFKKQFFISFIFVGSFTLIIVLNFLSKQLLFFYVLNGRALDSDILFVLATRYETTKGLLAR